MSDQYTDNPDLNAYDRIVRKTKFKHRLLSVHWELTFRCNERCTHCYLDVLPPNARMPGELSTEEAYRVIDELADIGALTITFSGGEVFLRTDLFDIARYARRKGFAIRFFTNGILIKPEIADKIAAVKPVAVETSLYSIHADVHDSITKIPGSHQLTLQAIAYLRERNIRCIVKTPLMKENIHEFEALRTFVEEMGVRFQYDTTIIPKHTGDRTPLQHRPNDDDLLAFMQKYVTPESWQIHPHNDDMRFCGIGMNSLTISPYGEIYTCIGARVSTGNIRRNSLQEIWHESPVWQETSSITLAQLPVCNTCELRPFCVRCHGTAAFEDGDMLGCSSIAYREARLRRMAYEAKNPTS